MLLGTNFNEFFRDIPRPGDDNARRFFAAAEPFHPVSAFLLRKHLEESKLRFTQNLNALRRMVFKITGHLQARTTQIVDRDRTL
ncbi:hypothetical protein D3C76_1719590 [compost metagenome]